jgi:hypothetical protein
VSPLALKGFVQSGETLVVVSTHVLGYYPRKQFPKICIDIIDTIGTY